MKEEKLPIVECFHSLQGEGHHTGKSAFFIRLALCKVGCHWCDTKESWSANKYPEESIKIISKRVANAQENGAGFVVITGGEPLHHNLAPLTKEIRELNLTNGVDFFPIHLETSGVEPLSGDPDWITLSPKKHAPPLINILKSCHELKVIIHEENDLNFAEEMAKASERNTKNQPLLFLQAGWNNKIGEGLVFEYVKKNPKWRLSMQTHKWLKIR